MSNKHKPHLYNIIKYDIIIAVASGCYSWIDDVEKIPFTMPVCSGEQKEAVLVLEAFQK